jgi:hypothetical protein
MTPAGRRQRVSDATLPFHREATPMAKCSRPRKPYPDFPLYAHASGRWAKKIRGKLYYFGKTADDPRGETALQRYLDDRDELYAGRVPRSKREGLTVGETVNRFLTARKAKVDSGEIAPAGLDRDFATLTRRASEGIAGNGCPSLACASG